LSVRALATAVASLSVRAQHVLYRGEIWSWKILKERLHTIQEIRQCGVVAASEIQEWAKKHGVTTE